MNGSLYFGINEIFLVDKNKNLKVMFGHNKSSQYRSLIYTCYYLVWWIRQSKVLYKFGFFDENKTSHIATRINKTLVLRRFIMPLSYVIYMLGRMYHT